MIKNRLLIAATAAVVGVIVARNLKTPSTPPVLLVPPLSPELQKWADYVEKYPNLEDDPKIAHAIEVLNDTEDPK